MESDAQWMLFCPHYTSWVCQADPFSITAAEAMQGAIRVALVNSCATGAGTDHCAGAPNGRSASSYAALLRQHAAAYPVKVYYYHQ